MTVTVKLGLFAAGLALVFLAALGVGTAVGPSSETPAPDHDLHSTTSTATWR